MFHQPSLKPTLRQINKIRGSLFFWHFLSPPELLFFIYKVFTLLFTEAEVYNMGLEINPLAQEYFWQNLAKNLSRIVLY